MLTNFVVDSVYALGNEKIWSMAEYFRLNRRKTVQKCEYVSVYGHRRQNNEKHNCKERPEPFMLQLLKRKKKVGKKKKLSRRKEQVRSLMEHFDQLGPFGTDSS